MVARAQDQASEKSPTPLNYKKWTYFPAYTIWETPASLIVFYSAWCIHESSENIAAWASIARIVSQIFLRRNLLKQLMNSLLRNLKESLWSKMWWVKEARSAPSASWSRTSKVFLKPRRMVICRLDRSVYIFCSSILAMELSNLVSRAMPRNFCSVF